NSKIKDFKSSQSEKEETTLLLQEIDRIAKETSLQVKSIKPRETSSDSFYSKTKIDITSETDMISLIKFLFLLGESNLIITIEKMKISASGINKNTVASDITISRLFIKQE
ncbi:type 4a pilus biogenesis protein PilO, partial [Chlamydiota bacterium]